MIELRRSSARGYADRGWLKSYHSFSFAGYYDPQYMQFSALRVINDDQIAGDAGFGMHAHRDMEIVTYMLVGALKHEDDMGNGSVIKAGDVQRMTAGAGVKHSEVNANAGEAVHLLQIWIVPAEDGLEPSYEERHFSEAQKTNQWCMVLSPNGHTDTLKINQDVTLYATHLMAERSVSCALNISRSHYIHIARGAVIVAGELLKSGDALLVKGESALHFEAQENTEILWFDLP